MRNSPEWWNDFWSTQPTAPITGPASQDTWYDLVWSRNYEYWGEIFDRHAPGRAMLECGCGSGKVSQYFAQKGFHCTLLDYSGPAIAIARDQFRERALTGSFVIGDLRRLSFPDQQFDIVFSGGVLEFFPDVADAIREMVRILKPGGVFAANMVPRKFSIQTVADWERTVAYSARNLLKGRLRDALLRVHHIPAYYPVNSLPLREYIRLCREAGLSPVHGTVTSPFPALALPGSGKRLYARMMKRLHPLWKRFDQSQSRWTEIWGIAYAVYGIKA